MIGAVGESLGSPLFLFTHLGFRATCLLGLNEYGENESGQNLLKVKRHEKSCLIEVWRGV